MRADMWIVPVAIVACPCGVDYDAQEFEALKPAESAKHIDGTRPAFCKACGEIVRADNVALEMGGVFMTDREYLEAYPEGGRLRSHGRPVRRERWWERLLRVVFGWVGKRRRRLLDTARADRV